MKKILIAVLLIIIICLVIWILIPSDTFNKMARKRIEFIDGNYNVTYSQDSITRIYNVRSGKITSTEKGYYFFFAQTPSGKKYRQVPIDNTIIEEL